MIKRIDFSKYSTIRVGPEMEVEIIDSPEWDKPDYAIIGGASNIIVTGRVTKLAKLGKSFDYIRIEEGHLVVGGATSSGRILSFVKKHDIAHFEFLSKLPGLLGGIVKMNGGLKEWEIFNHLVSIRTNHGTFTKDQVPHSYRHTEIEGVILDRKRLFGRAVRYVYGDA